MSTPTPTTSQTRRRAIVQISDALFLLKDRQEVGLVIRLLELMLEEVQSDFIKAPTADLPKVQATAGQLTQLLKMLTHPRAPIPNGEINA